MNDTRLSLRQALFLHSTNVRETLASAGISQAVHYPHRAATCGKEIVNEGSRSKVKSLAKWRFANARPEPDFRYRSKRTAHRAAHCSWCWIRASSSRRSSSPESSPSIRRSSCVPPGVEDAPFTPSRLLGEIRRISRGALHTYAVSATSPSGSEWRILQPPTMSTEPAPSEGQSPGAKCRMANARPDPDFR
jgi:hypothetical protein